MYRPCDVAKVSTTFVELGPDSQMYGSFEHIFGTLILKNSNVEAGWLLLLAVGMSVASSKVCTQKPLAAASWPHLNFRVARHPPTAIPELLHWRMKGARLRQDNFSQSGIFGLVIGALFAGSTGEEIAVRVAAGPFVIGVHKPGVPGRHKGAQSGKRNEAKPREEFG